MTLTVIDVGCHTHDKGTSSIEHLQAEFEPDTLIGLDPLATAGTYKVGRTNVTVFKAAAWIRDGAVPFTENGTGSSAGDGPTLVPCYDLADLILMHAYGDVILKLDAEGSEYVLIPWLVDHDVDLELKTVLVEWHCTACGVGGGHRPWCNLDCSPAQEKMAATLRCEVRRWER